MTSQEPTKNASPAKTYTDQPNGDATAQLLPNAAEKLFATNGFEGTSVRAIANESGIELGALHYYWGSKIALIRAVLICRLEPILAERKRRYSATAAGWQEPSRHLHTTRSFARSRTDCTRCHDCRAAVLQATIRSGVVRPIAQRAGYCG